VRFRARIFLAVLLPASLLVGASVAVGLAGITREGERSVREEFARTQRQVAYVLDLKRNELKGLREWVRKPVFREIVALGNEPQERPRLADEFDAELNSIQVGFEFLGVTGKNRKVWLARYGHVCSEACRHRADLDWAEGRLEKALFQLDGKALLGFQEFLPEDEGTVLMGRSLEADMDQLPVNAALFHKGRLVYLSRELAEAGWTARPGASGDERIGGTRFLCSSAALAEGVGDMLLLRSMKDVDDRRRDAVLFGAAGLGVAVIVAALVSLRVSRGISRPVETLVAATRKVGEGDYTVTVDGPGRDELADLGRAFNDMTGGLRKRREIMEKTLSRDVAEELMKGVELGGERREVTILFMDVRGFTSATEGVDPAVVVATLNDMMGELADAISRHGGNVNKFLGDGLMAMFGAPRDLPEHALQAARAALEMQKAMGAWNARRTGGLSGLRIGIGINTGAVVGGKVGSKDRLEYTLIGEEVNLASRVCGKAAPGQVLVTKQVFDRLGGRAAARELEPITVKGLSYPVQVYEVTA
jgi:class 3 adenylate cyclase